LIGSLSFSRFLTISCDLSLFPYRDDRFLYSEEDALFRRTENELMKVDTDRSQD
jgi:hypothetical protein